METIKDMLGFCNSAVFYDCKKIGIMEELNQVRKCIINIFYKTIPDSRSRVSLSIIDDKNLKIIGNEIENILQKIRDLRENIFYMLSFEKIVNDEQEIITPILNDDGE